MTELADMNTELRALRRELREAQANNAAATTDPATPRRVSNSEVLRALLERMRHSAASERASVRLTRNAKGDTQIEVLATSDDVDEAASEATRIYEAVRTLYPLAGVEIVRKEKGGDDA